MTDYTVSVRPCEFKNFARILGHAIKIDAGYAPFIYRDSEKVFKLNHKVNDSLSVKFKGSIDRVDEKEGVTRIIDYKSGQGELNYKEMEDLFDATNDKRPKPILQTFIYSYFYTREVPNKVLSPGIYFMRTSFTNFSSTVTCKGQPIDDIAAYFPEFESLLNEKILELFNQDIPFMQTENEENCKFCPFRSLCER